MEKAKFVVFGRAFGNWNYSLLALFLRCEYNG